jgi:hypothetical protein
MLQHRHWKLDIGPPLTDVALDVVSVVAEVLAGAATTREALAGAELTLQGEPDSVMRWWSRI